MHITREGECINISMSCKIYKDIASRKLKHTRFALVQFVIFYILNSNSNNISNNNVKNID